MYTVIKLPEDNHWRVIKSAYARGGKLHFRTRREARLAKSKLDAIEKENNQTISDGSSSDRNKP